MRSGFVALSTVCGSIACLAGCASVDTAAVVQRIVRPEVGQVTTREVGSPLFEVIVARTLPGVRIAAGSRIRTAPGAIIEPQGPFVAMGSIFCGPADQVADLGGVIRHPLAMTCLTEKQLQDQHVSYTLADVTRTDPANLQQELLYEGKIGKELKLSYREFHGDLARPAFTQDLTFDLADGDVVGAKGARIEVLKASNVEIEYKVLQPFSP